jgi:hypothetical protein
MQGIEHQVRMYFRTYLLLFQILAYRPNTDFTIMLMQGFLTKLFELPLQHPRPKQNE